MFETNKKLGQNFLNDKEIAGLMVEGVETSPGDTVVEIGPGLGVLTEKISEKNPKKLIAIDLDVRCIEELQKTFAGKDNIEIIEGNVLDWLPKFSLGTENLKIIGSLPYYITSPIIHAIIKAQVLPEIAVLMVQKEVGEKISNTEDSSYLSSFVQTFFDVEYVETVGKEKFDPAPKVDSAVIKFTKRENADLSDLDIRKYEGFLHRVYSNPRKMLNKVFKKEELDRTGIDGSKRPQNYGWNEWLSAYFTLQ